MAHSDDDRTKASVGDASRAIFTVWPQLVDTSPWVPLGDLPTPVEPMESLSKALGGACPVWVKRDDLTSPVYGGNKVRTLEVLFGRALSEGATHVFATGAFGSNHAVATVLHASRAGLAPGAILFPQPRSRAALENLQVTVGQEPALHPLWHWSLLPLGVWRARRRERRLGRRPYIMVPGGATPEGAMGYISAGLELAFQVEAGQMPAPEEIVVGVGSTCTSAGLLVGLWHAARLGIGWGEARVPRVVAVRVTPWPVTSPWRIAWLAHQASRLLAQRAGDPSLEIPWRVLRHGLEVDRRFLGSGYGKVTPSGEEAIRLFEAHKGPRLDTTYSGKSGAALVARARAGARGPLLYWATKSTASLPVADEETLKGAPGLMQRWMARVV